MSFFSSAGCVDAVVLAVDLTQQTLGGIWGQGNWLTRLLMLMAGSRLLIPVGAVRSPGIGLSY